MTTITLILIILKIFGLINIGWLWCFLPVAAEVVFRIGIIVIAYIWAYIKVYFF